MVGMNKTTALLAVVVTCGLALPAQAAIEQSINVALQANGGVASHVNSVDSIFGFVSANANDGNYGTMNHTDFDGANGGDAAHPDFLRIDFDQNYSLAEIRVYNRNDGSAGTRLDGGIIRAKADENTTVFESAPISGSFDKSVHVFRFLEFDGATLTGIDNINYIELELDNYLHVVEFEALTVPNFSLVVNRDDGNISLVNNTGEDVDILGYKIASASGSLNQLGWIPIAGHYDEPGNGGNGSVDNNDTWLILSDTNQSTYDHKDLSEFQLPPGDGGTIEAGEVVNLGSNVWIKSNVEDLELQIVLGDGTLQDVTVGFVGNNLSPYPRSDLDFDGDVDADDWDEYLAGLEVDLSGLSSAEAYQMGDLDDDGINSILDFTIFEDDYDTANGAGSFAEMLVGVPEPSSMALLLLGGLLLSRRRTRAIETALSRCAFKRSLLTGCVAVGAVLTTLTMGTQRAEAQLIEVAAGRPAFQSSAFAGYPASAAVDGNTNTITHTFTGDLNPWWYVDLGLELPVDLVSIYNRADCCGERLYNINVEFYDGAFAYVDQADVFNEWDGTGSPPDPGVGPHGIDLTGEPEGSLTGRYIVIRKTPGFSGSEWFSLAEVEIFVDLENMPLKAQVNRTTGNIQLVSNSDNNLTANFYRIESGGGSLIADDPASPTADGWDSLHDQEMDKMGEGNGQQWDEATGADSGVLAEAFLLGGTTLEASHRVGIGYAYDTAVDAQDLEFEYHDTISDRVLPGFVDYFESGDMNGDGTVDDLDVPLFILALTNRAAYQNMFPDLDADFVGDFDRNGLLDTGDIGQFSTKVAESTTASSNSVPEPSAAVLMVLCLGCLFGVRNRRECR